MQIRTLRLHGRNPLVGVALLLAIAGLVLAVVLVGLTLLAGLTVVGGAALLARRLLRIGRPRVPGPEPLDPGQEVFAPLEEGRHGRLPPGAG